MNLLSRSGNNLISSGNSLLRNFNNCILRGVVGNPAPYCEFTLGATPTLAINNLPPGRYSFDVEYRGRDGQVLGRAVVMVEIAGQSDAKGLRSSAESILYVNEGATASYNIQLASRPSGTVTVTPSSSNAGIVTVQPASFVFTATTWDQPQSLTVAAASDSDSENSQVTIRYSAVGGGYEGHVFTNQRVLVVDVSSGASPVMIISTGDSIIDEGAAATLSARVNVAPAARTTVTIAIDSVSTASPSDYSLSATTIVIGTDGVVSPSTIVISAVDDNVAEAGESVVLGYSSSVAEVSVPAPTTIVIRDNDTAGISSTAGTSLRSRKAAPTPTP